MCCAIYNLSFLRRQLALAVVLVIITMNFGNVHLHDFLEDFQDNVSQQRVFCADDGGQKGYGLNDFKPPKQSFIDYGSFFGNSAALPAYSPKVSLLIFFEVFKAIPQFYPDVLVPPHPFQPISG